jgi:hypothetical protein
MARFNVRCNGNNPPNNIPKVRDTITIGTSGNCTFKDFNFKGTGNPYYPQGFSNKVMASDGSTVSYEYDGTDIPVDGYEFEYSTNTPIEGDGTGKIKNS